MEPRLLLSTITVDSLLDNDPVGYTSLREAVEAAGTDDDIDFSVTGTITLTQGEIDIFDSLTINGGGDITVDADGGSRTFDVSLTGTEEVLLEGLTITGGDADDGMGGGIRQDGSGGTLTLLNCVITGNTAWGGGGIQKLGPGTLVVKYSYVTDNGCAQPEGAPDYGCGVGCGEPSQDVGGMLVYGGTVYIINSVISANYSETHGGGIGVMWGDVTINNSTIADNYAEWDGGGIWMHAGSLEINNSIIALNTAGDDGPDIYGTVDYLRYSLVSDTSDAVFTYEMWNAKDVDPEFVRDPGTKGSGDWGDLRITAGSPARSGGHEDYAVDEDGVPLVKDLWLFIDEDDGSLGQGPGSADEFSEGPRMLGGPDRGAYELDVVNDRRLWYDVGEAGYQESDELPEINAFLSGWAPEDSVTGHSHGITHIVIDVTYLADNITSERVTVSDFIFKTSTSQGSWTTLTGDDLPEVEVDRENNKVFLDWGVGEIEDVWLMVAIKANANTALVPIGQIGGTNVGDTFYFGSLVGDVNTKLVAGEFIVDTTDLTILGTFWGSDNEKLYEGDLNLSGDVDNTDLTILSTNFNETLFWLNA